MKKPKRVVIVGGGIAGLSAAHELVERGYDVHVYERRGYLGGKAASVQIAENDRHQRGGLPGEHGFRFFPGWYRHLPHTMARIPYRNRTVADNLVAAEENIFGSYQRDPVRALLRLPANLKDIAAIGSFFEGMMSLGLTPQDMRFFFGKLWEFLTASEERRVTEFDKLTWWDFMEADKQSQAFRDYLVIAATRSTVAANPRQASAYTIAKMAIQTLMDSVTPITPADRVLNGPTHEVFIDPWRDFLEEQGVQFHLNAELESIEFKFATPEISELKFTFNGEEVRKARLRYEAALQRYEVAVGLWGRPPAALAEVADKGEDDPAIERAVADMLAAEKSTNYGEECKARFTERPPAVAKRAATVVACRTWSQLYFNRYQKAVAEAQKAAREPVAGDYFVFALPIEQMAYHVHVSETMRQADPSLINIVRLAEHVDWMAGIQFYFSEKLEITRGHIACLDSPWQLTAIEHLQFWPDIDVEDRNRAKVKSILSVDISAWDHKGDKYGLEAFNCDNQQIAEEVWHQLERTLNRPGRPPALRKELLIHSKNGTIDPGSYYIDESIVDRFDRKKQAVYDKSATVRFDAARLLEKQSWRGQPTETPYVYGQRLRLNAEPLLVNRVGALPLRPSVKTRIPNMFLAADYVRTMTNLATMEAANEAARAAVNEILLAAGDRKPLCEMWPLKEPMELFRTIDAVLFKRKQRFEDTYADIPVRLMAGAATAATNVFAKTLSKVLDTKETAMSANNINATFEAHGPSGGSGRGATSPTSIAKPGDAAWGGWTPYAAGEKYYFSLSSALRPVDNKGADGKGAVGFEVAEGIRLHVNYVTEKKQVITSASRLVNSWTAPNPEWTGITGEILSGGDWVLVQKNGVARFDARVTIKTDDNVLIDAVFTGAVDLRGALRNLKGNQPIGKEVYDRYTTGAPDVDSLPVALSVRFEAAEQPYLRQGEDDTWIARSRYARQRANFPKYQRLMRGLFVARGDVKLKMDPRWPPEMIRLDIFELS